MKPAGKFRGDELEMMQRLPVEENGGRAVPGSDREMQWAEARAGGENLLLKTWRLRSLEDNHVQINACTRWESRSAAEGGAVGAPVLDRASSWS